MKHLIFQQLNWDTCIYFENKSVVYSWSFEGAASNWFTIKDSCAFHGHFFLTWLYPLESPAYGSSSTRSSNKHLPYSSLSQLLNLSAKYRCYLLHFPSSTSFEKHISISNLFLGVRTNQSNAKRWNLGFNLKLPWIYIR